MPSTRDYLTSRWSTLDSEYSSWDSQYRELSKKINPMTGRFSTGDHNKGNKKHSDIINETGLLAQRTLASGMMAGLTSPARPWFRLVPPDPDMSEFQPVREWLDKVERLFREIYARSNIYNTFHTMYGELGLYGTAPFIMVDDFESVLRTHPFTCGTYRIATNDKQKVDTLYRRYTLTVLQMVQQFGRDGLSQTAKDAYDRGRYDATFVIYQAIERDNDLIDLPRVVKRPYVSIHWQEGADDGKYLKVSGFDQFRVVCPRWTVNGTDTYGGSPGMEALGGVKQLQLQEKDTSKAIQKTVDPPMVAPASMKKRAKNTLPGGVTYWDGVGERPMFTPAYQINFDIASVSAKSQEIENRINRAFYVDLFMMLANSDRRQITAREVQERHEEKLLGIGPVIERLNDEALDAVIDLTFDIGGDAGILPPAPPEIQGAELGVEYISVLAQAQQMVGLAGIERLVGFAGNLAGADPTVLDKIDFDQTIDEYAQMVGSPQSIVRSDDDVALIRQARQQKEDAMQRVAMLQQAAEGAKTLSDADMESDNALSRITQSIGAAP